MRQHRLLQKRGKIIEADDYREITGTYPQFPLSEYQPPVGTNRDLQKHRLNLEKADIKQKKDAKEAKMSAIKNVSFKDYY